MKEEFILFIQPQGNLVHGTSYQNNISPQGVTKELIVMVGPIIVEYFISLNHLSQPTLACIMLS